MLALPGRVSWKVLAGSLIAVGSVLFLAPAKPVQARVGFAIGIGVGLPTYVPPPVVYCPPPVVYV
ncbi:MAG: hypothetical protein HKL95_04970, partial [Phycisphaerae bacterium]|nr:hypothetical protein [Phycisphaerae bacterium]